MHANPSRRDFVAALPAAGVAAAFLQGSTFLQTAAAQDMGKADAPVDPAFPRYDPMLIKDIVGASHMRIDRVREILEQHPALAGASWDWGFGDWESALGAASHMGNRPIAELLLAHGARINIFTAAMLGMTDVVKAFVTAQPGIQRTLGPHGITLLAHARAGREQAAETLAYLESLGDADMPAASIPLPKKDRKIYLGSYRFGDGNDHVLHIQPHQGELKLTPGEDVGRPIHFLGEHEFFPAGVPGVRLRFEVSAERADALTIVDHKPIVRATRTES